MIDNMKGPRETLPPDKEQDNADHGEPANAQLVPDETGDEDPVKAEDLLEDYGWMAEEEEYDQQVIEELEEEEHIEENFHEMWEEEERSLVYFNHEGRNGQPEDCGLESGVNGIAIAENGHEQPESGADEDEAHVGGV